jgi:hypothetical protein
VAIALDDDRRLSDPLVDRSKTDRAPTAGLNECGQRRWADRLANILGAAETAMLGASHATL